MIDRSRAADARRLQWEEKLSDLSGLDRDFGLPSAAMLPPGLQELHPSLAALLPVDVQVDEVSFRELQGRGEIARVLHLREEIQLPAIARGNASFAVLEKKETKSAWSAPSCASARP